MPKNPLFSTYRQGENRVTASMLAVFERVSLDVLQDLMAAASGEASLSFVEFRNQLGGPQAVPDASIRASFHYLFEVKTARDALRGSQLRGHLERLDRNVDDQRLFVVTPDGEAPRAVGDAQDGRVAWFSFRELAQAIEQVVSDPLAPASAQERFLLRELQALFEQEGLISRADVLVVAANVAYGEYLQYGAYICQPGRSFRSDVERLAFYRRGEIKREVPRILARRDPVLFTIEEANRLARAGGALDDQLGEVIRSTLTSGIRKAGKSYQVFLLSPSDDPLTLKLPSPVRNASPRAWVQGQRYTRSDLLERAQTTDDLRAA